MSDKVEIPDEAAGAADRAIRAELRERGLAGYLGEAALEAALPLLPASGGPAVDRQVIERVLEQYAVGDLMPVQGLADAIARALEEQAP